MRHFAITIAAANHPRVALKISSGFKQMLKSVSVVYRNVNYQHFYVAAGLATEGVPCCISCPAITCQQEGESKFSNHSVNCQTKIN